MAGLLAALALAALAALVQQPDPCTFQPDLPNCPEPGPPPPEPSPFPEPVAGVEWTQVVTWGIGVLFALLFILNHYGFIPDLREWWAARRADRARYGHGHGEHHRKKPRRNR